MPRSPRIASASTEVGPFAPSATSRAWIRARVLARHLVLARGEDEDVAGQLEQLLVRDRASRPGSRRATRARRSTRAARRRRGPPRRGRRRTRPRPPRRARPSPRAPAPRPPPTFPKPWTTQRCPASGVPSRSHARSIDHHDARAGRLLAEERAAERDRLAGDDLRHGVADLHRVGVHHPGHRLLVRRHVRRGDVLLRPDEREQLRGEAAREPLQLALRERRAARTRTPPFAPP